MENLGGNSNLIWNEVKSKQRPRNDEKLYGDNILIILMQGDITKASGYQSQSILNCNGECGLAQSPSRGQGGIGYV